MLAPLPCTSTPMEWPVRCVKYSPYPLRLDDAARRVVHLEPAQRLAARRSPPVTRLIAASRAAGDHVEDLAHLVRRIARRRSAST